MTFYEELGVSADATEEQIRQAHRRLVKLLHPDRQQNPELRRMAERQLVRVNGLVEQLLSSPGRAAYDISLQPRPAILPAPSPVLKPPVTWKLAGLGFGAIATLIFLALVSPGDSIRSESSPSRPRVGAEAKPEGAGSEAMSPQNEYASRAATRRPRPQPGGEPENLQPSPAREPQANPPQEVGDFTPPPSVPQTPLPAVPLIAIPAAPAPALQPAIDGTWLYAGGPTSGRDHGLYRPEYIELRLAKDTDGTLRGEYRGRYAVTDLAISPTVSFRFREKHPNLGALPWQGPKGSEGVVSLQLVGTDVMQVDWKTTEAGGNSGGLTFGTATLIRRR